MMHGLYTRRAALLALLAIVLAACGRRGAGVALPKPALSAGSPTAPRVAVAPRPLRCHCANALARSP